MIQDQFNRLVDKAKQYNSYSESYAQSLMYASRNETTGISEIAQAINKARGLEHKKTDNELFYILINDAEFGSAEKELKQAVSKLVDVQIKIHERYNLTARESNIMLERMCNDLKLHLFTKTKLSDYK